MSKLLTVFLLFLTSAVQISAHDFWLEPHQYTADPGKEIAIDWRIGQGFLGETMVFLPFNAETVGVWVDGKWRNLSPRFAAKPALKVVVPNEGSSIVVTETPFFELTYDSWAEFESFVEKEQIPFDLPEAQIPPIQEQYRRYTKALISATGDSWEDARIGLRYEWVLTRQSDSVVSAQLWFDGEPAKEHSVKLYRKSASDQEEIEPTHHRTDREGRFVVEELYPGEEILLNAIYLEYDPGASEWPWKSHWASLVFAW